MSPGERHIRIQDLGGVSRRKAGAWTALGALGGIVATIALTSSGVLRLGQWIGDHDRVMAHLTQADPLIPRFIATEQAVGRIDESLTTLVSEVKQLNANVNQLLGADAAKHGRSILRGDVIFDDDPTKKGKRDGR